MTHLVEVHRTRYLYDSFFLLSFHMSGREGQRKIEASQEMFPRMRAGVVRTAGLPADCMQ
jgi:hypothetical protein